MIKNLLARFFGYRLGQVVYANDFDRIEWFKNSASFEEFDAYKGNFGYRVIFNSEKNSYLIAKKYRL